MSYQTGNALDVNDLLDKWRIFLLAEGWLLDYWGDRVGGFGKALQLHQGGKYFSWFSETTVGADASMPGPWIRGIMHTSYGTQGSTTQPGSPGATVGANRLTGPMQAYHFFAGAGKDGPYAYIVIEVEPGTFRHIGMGTLDKMGAYTGGDFVFASHWYYSPQTVSDALSGWHGMPFDDVSFGIYQSQSASSIVRADYGGTSPRYHHLQNGDNTTFPRGRGGWRAYTFAAEANGTIKLPFLSAASVLTGRAPLLPLWVAVNRGSGLWSDVGLPPDMRFVRMDNMEPGQEYTLGTDTWVVFPVARKNGANGLANSSIYGYAYRKVA